MDWYRQEFDIPQTASTQQTLHLLASEQLIIAQDAGNYAITNLGALLFARDLNDFPTVARKALRVIRYDGPSPISPSRSKTFFSGYAKLDQALEYVEALLPEQEVTNPGSSLVDVARLLNDPPHSRNEKMAAICR